MSVDHLKKQAKNAKRLLAGLFEQHPPPYSLAECQELTAGLNGYPSWRIALESQRRKPIQRDDPIAAFYGYDWRKVSVKALAGLEDPARCQVNLLRLSPDEALTFLQSQRKPDLGRSTPFVLINAAGEAGGQIIDQVFDDKGLMTNFVMSSLTTLSHRIGATINPVAGLAAPKVAELFAAIIAHVGSAKQVKCSREALDLLLSGLEEDEFDIPIIQRSVDRLINLSNGGWSKNDEDFYETFPDEDRHDEAHKLIACYDDELPSLLRPLDALLTRLAAPGLDRTFSPKLCKESHEWREEAFNIHDEMGIAFHGLEMVNIDFGSDLIDHLAAHLVLAKVLYASRFHTEFGFTDDTPVIYVILIQPTLSD